MRFPNSAALIGSEPRMSTVSRGRIPKPAEVDRDRCRVGSPPLIETPRHVSPSTIGSMNGNRRSTGPSRRGTFDSRPHKHLPGGLEGRGARGATRHWPNGEERPVRRGRARGESLSEQLSARAVRRAQISRSATASCEALRASNASEERSDSRARRGLPSHDRECCRGNCTSSKRYFYSLSLSS